MNGDRQMFRKGHCLSLKRSPFVLYFSMFEKKPCTRARNISTLTLPIKKEKLLCKFRTCNIKLPIEIGRWNNTRREERKCNLCNTNDLSDGFHYIFSCDQIDIKTMRKKCLPVYYYRKPNTFKFERLFNCTDQNTLIMLCKFINVKTLRLFCQNLFSIPPPIFILVWCGYGTFLRL